jgi:hypothetical protein
MAVEATSGPSYRGFNLSGTVADKFLMIVIYSSIAFMHTMLYFRSEHPQLIRYRMLRLTAFALLVPVVIWLSMAHNWLMETNRPDYFQVPALFISYISLNIVFKTIFKRYYTA